MKNYISLLSLLSALMLMVACEKNVEEVNYVPGISIGFQEVGDSNIVQTSKGAAQYTAKIEVKATGSIISAFEIYSADAQTGNQDTLIDGTTQSFEQAASHVSASFTIPDLSENRCIKVVVTDTLGQTYEKNLVVKITPAVYFSNTVQIETVENYYGPYYASWLNGRVYMRRSSEYKDAVVLSLGDIINPGIDTLPSLVDPSQRSKYGLLTIEGLQSARFAATDLTGDDYQAISQIDAAPITALGTPNQEVVAIAAGGVYLFKTAGGTTGLIHVESLTQKTGTIEQSNGNWVADTPYYEAAISTKTLAP
ncbi:hypothetical protein GCM10027051_26830 [Niabella terrae]